MGRLGGRRGRAGARELGHGHRAAGERGRGHLAQMPHRPRAGRLGGGVCRPSAGGLARAGHGWLALERALRSRNRLLEEARPDSHWLDAIEHETAELAVAVTASRVETVGRLQTTLAARKHPGSAFPAAEIALDGWMERLVPVSPAVEVEDRYRAVLKDNRARDAAAHRTLDGPHLSDLAVTHAEKQIAAADASTGEQKALLIGLVLAHAGLLAEMSGLAPVLLLDEVVAHLDPARRSALYAELDALGAQAWMTGADAAVFAEIEGKAEVFEVLPGEVKRT